jgi:flagellar hook-length control protein FliK
MLPETRVICRESEWKSVNFNAQKSIFSIGNQTPSASKKGARSVAVAQKKTNGQPLWTVAPVQTFASFLQPLQRTNPPARQASPQVVPLRPRNCVPPAARDPIPKQDGVRHSLTFSPAPSQASPTPKPLTVAIPPPAAPANPSARQASPQNVPLRPRNCVPPMAFDPIPKRDVVRHSLAFSPAPAEASPTPKPRALAPQPQPAAENLSGFKLTFSSSTGTAPQNVADRHLFTRETPQQNISPNIFASSNNSLSEHLESYKYNFDRRFPTITSSPAPITGTISENPRTLSSDFAATGLPRLYDTGPLKTETLSPPSFISDAGRPVESALHAGDSANAADPGDSRLNTVPAPADDKHPLRTTSAHEPERSQFQLEMDSPPVRAAGGFAGSSISSTETPQLSDAKPDADSPAPSVTVPGLGYAARRVASHDNLHPDTTRERPTPEPAAASAEEPDGADSGAEDFSAPATESSGNGSPTGDDSLSEPSTESRSPTCAEFEEISPSEDGFEDSVSEGISPEGADGTGSRNGSVGGSGGSSGSSSTGSLRSVPFAVKLTRTAKRPAPQKTPLRPRTANAPRRSVEAHAVPRALKPKPVASADPVRRLEPMQAVQHAHRAKSANANHASAEKIARLQEVRELADKIQARARLLDGSKERWEIKLNPPQLGRISVQLETEGVEMRLIFFTAQDETAQALKEARPELAQLLHEQGYQLTRCDIENHLPSRNPLDPQHSTPSQERASREDRHAAEDTPERDASSQKQNRPLFLGYNTMDVIA